VKVTVAEHVLGEKVRVFTYKPKKTFKKARGHRSRLSKLTVESITLKEEKEKKGGA
jgi:large subunit ribosomal protein L21